MKVFDVFSEVSGSGEYVLGHDATGSHACYLIYGVLRPGEGGRELRPGRGHEEMVLCIAGEMHLKGAVSVVLRRGQAVHLRGDEACTAENVSAADAAYVIAGGHSEGSAHH